jgi:Zn-dependent metalloprotease
MTEATLGRVTALRSELGLDARTSFAPLGVLEDGLGQVHTRVQQLYKGVRVWGGEAIVHEASGNLLGLTRDLRLAITLDTTPGIGQAEALALVQADLAPKGPYASTPRAELVVYPCRRTVAAREGVPEAELDAMDMRRVVDRYLLAWHVSTALENGAADTRHMEYLVDAQTGAILRRWDGLMRDAARGTGLSQYSGTVTLDVNGTAKGFEMRDMTRGNGGSFGNNVVTDLDHGIQGLGTIYTSATDTWGDGANYGGGTTTSANGQTAAVDAAYGLQWTWDYYRAIHGRDGIDNHGTATSMRMHYDKAYDNAFWDDTCFCMTFGDGKLFKSLEALDVMGHEMSHGVCAATANLVYSDESGGLNEANSDINGTMVEFYARSGGGATVGEQGGNWTIGEDMESPRFNHPLRYMYKPSLDGQSPDAWTVHLGDLDVHYSSGPMNRAFYFLSQGASAQAGDTHSDFLPQGMRGVGNDHAARIWYRALTVYMTSESGYADARKDSILAARDLYGAGSPEEQAAWNAFRGIHVGPAWSNGTR